MGVDNIENMVVPPDDYVLPEKKKKKKKKMTGTDSEPSSPSQDRLDSPLSSGSPSSPSQGLPPLFLAPRPKAKAEPEQKLDRPSSPSSTFRKKNGSTSRSDDQSDNMLYGIGALLITLIFAMIYVVALKAPASDL